MNFSYQLPKKLIKKSPYNSDSNCQARLIVVEKKTSKIQHKTFDDIPSFLTDGDLLVLNDSQAIPSQIKATDGERNNFKISIQRVVSQSELAVKVINGEIPKLNTRLFFCKSSIEAEVIGYEDGAFIIHLKAIEAAEFIQFLEKEGNFTLPHYAEKRQKKCLPQTIYSKKRGSIFPPTAGLHFSRSHFEILAKKGIKSSFVTLHVNASTLDNHLINDPKSHKMHKEYLDVPEETCNEIKKAKQSDHKVVAVGTTTVRSLETASKNGVITPYIGDTSLFIYPGYVFKTVDAMITNLHAPHSTLLMMVCALGGYELVMEAYRQAVQHEYFFCNYGDSMLII